MQTKLSKLQKEILLFISTKEGCNYRSISHHFMEKTKRYDTYKKRYAFVGYQDHHSPTNAFSATLSKSIRSLCKRGLVLGLKNCYSRFEILHADFGDYRFPMKYERIDVLRLTKEGEKVVEKLKNDSDLNEEDSTAKRTTSHEL